MMLANQFAPESCLILVVDDNPSNLQLVGNVLRTAGYGITFAATGLQALDRLASAQPNLVLLDLMMPEMDGLEVCKRIRADPHNSETPIIFLTASHEHDHLLKAFALGAVDYVTKPFSHQELLARVQTHLLLQYAQATLADLNEHLEAKVQQRTVKLQQALSFASISQQITERLRNSLDETEILTTVVQELGGVFALDRCQTGIYDLSESTSTITHEYAGALPPTKGSVYNFSDFSELYAQLCQGQIVQTNLSPTSAERLQLPGSATLLACPLRDEKQILGDLWLYRLNQVAFEKEEISLVEHIAAQSAIAIRQARLYQATQVQVEELERLNYAKNDFLRSITHELRTPLTTIKAASDTLVMILKQPGWQTSQRKTAQQSLSLLQEGCRREIRLVDDLLELVHLDIRDQPAVFETVQLDLLVLDTLQLFSQRAQQHQQTLDIEIEQNLPDLATDPEILENVLCELLNNACKYTPSGETIKVVVTHDDACFQISVINSEVTLPEVDLNQLFEKFYRLPQSDRWQHGGMGLGLALVKKQVEYLGGAIAANYQDKCFTITIELPACEVEQPVAPVLTKPS